MKRTELAHWRYRVKALERDVAQSNENIAAYLRFEPRLSELFDVTEARAQLKLEVWLLEEAKYKSELGSPSSKA